MHFISFSLAVIFSIFITGCGSGSFSNDLVSKGSIADFDFLGITLPLGTPKSDSFRFNWNGDPTGLTYTVCLEDTTKTNNCDPIKTVTNVNYADVRLRSLLKDFSKDIFILASTQTLSHASTPRKITNDFLTSIIQYIKPSSMKSLNNFGFDLDLSYDGNTLVVSSLDEGIKNVNSNAGQLKNYNVFSGTVYVFKRTLSGWEQQADLNSSNSDGYDRFGSSLSISADGKIIAVGAIGESSNATGINGDQQNNAFSESGAVYIFQLEENNWTQKAYIKASNTQEGDQFGANVSLNEDGTRLAVGAQFEDSNANGVDGDQLNNNAPNAGAVYTFTRKADIWSQESYIKASNSDPNDNFGLIIKLNSKGNVLAVSSPYEQSNAMGIDGDDTNNSLHQVGAVYLYYLINNKWQQNVYIKASNSDATDLFGSSLSIDASGTLLVVGAPGESSDATGANGEQINNNATKSGAVYLFKNTNGQWAQEAYLKASNTRKDAYFGRAVSFNAEGSNLAVGSYIESSNAIGINGDQFNSESPGSGAAYFFENTNGDWVQTVYIKAPNTDAYDNFGHSLSLSGNGDVLAVNAISEGSSSSHINGDQTDNSLSLAGAVYVY